MSNPKIKRLKRIESLEQKKLDAVVVELKQINQQIAERESACAAIEQHLQQALDDRASTTSVSIESMLQLVTWSDAAANEIEAIELKLDEDAQERGRLMAEVAAQRARIKGWTLLTEKMITEQVDAESQAAFLEADERVLRNLTALEGE